ncbi:hypothetical protein C8J57DRAFT_1680253 [Mycena rebaudengoi]|nr:hypothetical protein C8J57DRAFT_1680253 [Mycena rebaudengoi]
MPRTSLKSAANPKRKTPNANPPAPHKEKVRSPPPLSLQRGGLARREGGWRGWERERRPRQQRRHGHHQRRRTTQHAHAHHRPRRTNKRNTERKGGRTDAGDAADPCGATDEDMRLNGRGHAIPPRLGDAQLTSASVRHSEDDRTAKDATTEARWTPPLPPPTRRTQSTPSAKTDVFPPARKTRTGHHSSASPGRGWHRAASRAWQRRHAARGAVASPPPQWPRIQPRQSRSKATPKIGAHGQDEVESKVKSKVEGGKAESERKESKGKKTEMGQRRMQHAPKPTDIHLPRQPPIVAKHARRR